MSQHSSKSKESEDKQSKTASSRSSHSSATSRSSKICLTVAMAKAKAEAAQARAAHSQREIELKVEQARIQANLDALNEEKEKDAAIAEVNTLVAGLEDISFEMRSEAKSQISQSIKNERVAAYLSAQASQCNEEQIQVAVSAGTMPQQILQDPQASGAPPQHSSTQPLNLSPGLQLSRNHPLQNIKLDPSSPAQPHVHEMHYRASQADSTSTGDLIKFLTRNSLVTSGLTTYDDQPMNYWSWKMSFQNATKDLELSAAEELDLLAKYLGKESAEQVRRIKTVNIKNPTTGLFMAWRRLDEIYGSPEAVEQALFNKLESFPKVTMKEPQRLRDLADLLSELQAAKEDGYLASLSYLDTSRGIKPIIEKLPYNTQEKWLYFGTRYKQEHLVSFPPFSVLVNFISSEARARTDPGFTPFMPATAERKSKWERPMKTSVNVHKTLVSRNPKSESKEVTECIDPNKHCPLHKKPHPLRKCRGFCEKSVDDRKQLLKEHHICFRCCSSTEHFAKNCTAEIKCTECESTAHVSALHPSPSAWKPKSSPSTSEDGGEEDKAEIQEVKSTCMW